MKLDDYLKLGEVAVSASIYEKKEGKDYAGFVKFDDLSDMFKYELTFSRNLKRILTGLEKKPLTVLAMTDFEIKDCRTNRKLELEDYSAFELIGITVGGARSILQGKYDEVNGVRMSFAKTKIRRTKSIEKIIEYYAGRKEK